MASKQLASKHMASKQVAGNEQVVGFVREMAGSAEVNG